MESVWFPRQKEPLSSRRCIVPEWSGYRRTHFTRWVFIFLLQISPSACDKLSGIYLTSESSDLFLSCKLFRLFPPSADYDPLMSCLHQREFSPLTLVSSHSPETVSISLIGKSKLPPGVSVPKKVVRQIFLPLPRRLLGSAPARPVTLMTNKRWLTGKMDGWKMEWWDDYTILYGLP